MSIGARGLGAPAGVSPAGAVERLNDAINRADVAGVVAAITDDCVFESTMPPDGDRYEGAAAIRDFFERLFASAHYRHFDIEETIVAGDRVIVRWLHRWGDHEQPTGHVRGVDLFTIRDGRVAEKLSYVKG